MYLKKFTVKNYSAHKSTSIDLSPLTILVGPNGGGKSALFDALLNFSMVSRGKIGEAFGEYPYSYRAVLHHGSPPLSSRIRFEADMCRSDSDSESLHYYIEYAQLRTPADGSPSYVVYNEHLEREPSGEVLFDRSNPTTGQLSKSMDLEPDRSLFSALRRQGQSEDQVSTDLVAHCAANVSRFYKFRLDPHILSIPSSIPDIGGANSANLTPRIGYNGEDLASTLYYLNQTSAPELEEIGAHLRRVDPGFGGFEFNTVQTNKIGFSCRYDDDRGTIAAARLSSGTLTFIGLLVLALSPKRPALVMIEEPENGLAPVAIKEFYRCIRDLSSNPEASLRSQTIVSSHSPFLVEEAWNGSTDHKFIYHVKLEAGAAVVRPFEDVLRSEGGVLKTNGQISVRLAQEALDCWL